MSYNKQWLSFFALLLLFALLLPMLCQGLTAPLTASVTATVPETVIIVDAGHGGIDGGATGVDGVQEKDLNLKIARQLAVYLRLLGATVVETREKDVSLASPDAVHGHVKQSDLENRVRLAEGYSDAIFISIHMNTFPEASCHGLQVWYSENHQGSKTLANGVQRAVKEGLQQDNNRKIKAATNGIYVLRHLSCPAILIECGFLSNAAECQALESEQMQKKLAIVMANAIINFKKMPNGTCAMP